MGQMSLHRCDRIRELISASTDRELSQLDGARVQAHLTACSSCRSFAAAAAEVSRLIRATPLEPLAVPIVLPGRRLAVAGKLQAAAAAAAVVATIGLSAAVATMSSSPRPQVRNSAQPSKLRFPEQELRMLQRASQPRTLPANHSRLTAL